MVPSWLSLEGPDLALKTDLDPKVIDLIASDKPGTPVLPMIQNATDGNWNGPGLAKLLADPVARAARLKDILAFITTNKFQA